MRAHAVELSRHGVALCVLCGLAVPLWAADDVEPLPAGEARRAMGPSGDTEQLLAFDIPAQPLAAALDQYATMAARPAVFRSTLVAGRMSSPVRGRYTAQAALRLLLDGTGLVADDVAAGRRDAFVLKPAATGAFASTAALGARSGPASDLADYDGLVQVRIWTALCANPRTAPGDYRALLRFRVDPGGRIQKARILGSSGDGRRDTALLEILHRVEVDLPPPPGMPQPLTMLVLPRGQIAGQACAGGR